MTTDALHVLFQNNFAIGLNCELVSFLLDNDQTWRVSGYFPATMVQSYFELINLF